MQQLFTVSLILLWMLVLLNLLLTLAIIRKINTPLHSVGGLKNGTKAPDFFANTIKGEAYTLNSFRGRSAVLVFISSHCQPCRDLLSIIEDINLKAKHANVEIVLVMMIGSVTDAQNIIDEYKLTLPLLIAPQESNSFTQNYNIFSTPSYCFLNQEHIVVSSGIPSMEARDWSKLVKSWEMDAKGETEPIPVA